MAEQAKTSRGFGRRGDRGAPRGERGAPRAARRGGDDKGVWTPCTKLGRLVKAGKITLDEIFHFGLAIKEPQIIDKYFGEGQLSDEVMKIMPVQKVSAAGQRTRFKAYVAVGDQNGHLGLGSKASKEVAGAIQGAIRAAKLALIPVRRGYWGSKIGAAHTIPMKVHGKCGSVRVRLIPAPRGSGVVGSPVTKKMLGFAGVHDCFSCTTGHSRTRGNFIYAIYYALAATQHYLTPDFWAVQELEKSPLMAASFDFKKSESA